MIQAPDPTFAAPIIVAATAAIFAVLVLAVSGAATQRTRRRFEQIRERARGAPRSEAAARPLARRESATPRIDRLARHLLPRRDMLAARLARTGRPISIGQYVIATLIVGALATVGLIFFARISLLPGVLFGAVIGAGLPISEAIIGASHEIGEPVAGELRGVENGMRLGRDLEALLWDIAQRIDTPEFRFFVIALSVQRETGGNLAETLANLSDVLRKRRQMRAKVRAMASETRATTLILGGLPVVVMIILALTSPEYLKPLYTDVRGIFLDVVAAIMLGSGIFIMNRMAKFEI